MRGLIIGIDPGPTHSAYAVLNPDGTVHGAAKVENYFLRCALERWLCREEAWEVSAVCVESIQSYGMPVGRETFETCYEIGRIQQICGSFGCPTHLYPRQEYVNAICGTKGSDAILRQALLLRFGGDRKGEPLHALKGSTDLRSAYAVAVYHIDKMGWSVTRAARQVAETVNGAQDEDSS